jgi:hypothetical protein
MKPPKGSMFMRGFLLGLGLSLGLGLAAAYLLTALDVISVSLLQVPELQAIQRWVERNLGMSVLPFSITLLLYGRSLRRLAQRLEQDRAPEEVAQLEHLIDVWISLFFGIGVIWTAIGMRGALLFALGDMDQVAGSGAFVVLQRLVDGGILTALTTTIVGGAGGYLMRLLKSLYLGTRLSRYYEVRDRHDSGRIEALLQDIRSLLERPDPGKPTAVECEGGRL